MDETTSSRRHRPPSLRRSLLGAVLITTGFSVGILGTALALDGAPFTTPDTIPAPSAAAPVDRPLAEGSAAALIAEHDCWTGEAPADMADQVPGAVVVTKPDGRTVYGGTRLAGLALEQLFDGVDHGLTVHAFCRGGDR